MAVSRAPHLYRTRIPTARWKSAALSTVQKTVLKSIICEAQQTCVKQSVGCKAVSPRGLKVLFVGPSGTGKTLAGELLANGLLTNLAFADLTTLKSRYIGETEKNLARVFDAGAKRGWVLFFDEADALFGKRTRVKDSHNKYANQEVSYLLQRIESYKGLVILSGNSKNALGSMLTRRMKYVVEFPVLSSHTGARFELYRDLKKRYQWRLRSENDTVLAMSEDGFSRKADCLKSITLVQQLAPQASIPPKP
jgi:AAA+ superfamily predicted ATPase